MSNILVVGSIAYDSVETPSGKVSNVLGGSANYFSLAASLYSPVRIVGVVGRDYKDSDLQILKERNVDLTGLKIESGETFRWAGTYVGNINEAVTLKTELNVFKDFDPVLPESYKDSEFVFLANIDPTLQLKVLDQVEKPKVVGLDTMNFWIDSKIDELKKVLKRVDLFLLNETEAFKIAGTKNVMQATTRIMEMGPKVVIVKRGEYGFFTAFEENLFVMPAYPIKDVIDPTGAGDTFAGGFFGYMSEHFKGNLMNPHLIKEACVQGCVMASFAVEDFSTRRTQTLTLLDVKKRRKRYLETTTIQP